MILVSVGTQLGFDRLVRSVDEWHTTRPDVEMHFQIGNGEYRPRHGKWTRFMDFGAYHELARQSDLLVSHAGMGALLTALEMELPLLVMPRRGHLGEHRNDHQQDAARHIFPTFGVTTVRGTNELRSALDDWESLPAPNRNAISERKQLAPSLANLVDELL